MEKCKFIFYGKILGNYYELNINNDGAKLDSKIEPASTVVWFKQNCRKAYPGYKLFFNKVG